MVRFCVYPNCPNKMTTWTNLSFHRLPLLSTDVLKLWLVALKKDPNTPVDTLRLADHRVCSMHFAADDFFPGRQKPHGTQKVQRLRLRKNAIPKVAEGTTDTMEESASGAGSPPEADFEIRPQSTPIKSQHRADEEPSGSSRPDLSSLLTILLTSPPQTTTRTRPSRSGKYLALPPICSQSVERIPSTSTSTLIPAHPSASTPSAVLRSEHEEEMEPVSDLSTSFGDLGLDPADVSFGPPSSDPPSSTGTTSGSASSCGDTTTGWAEKKWLVNESHLLQLFQTCPKCTSLITETKINTKGSQIKIHWTCGKHFGDWQSCPDRRGMPENNLQVCASIVFTGATYTDIADWASLLNVPIPHQTQFQNIQKTYLLPVIQSTYKDKHDQIKSRLIDASQSGNSTELCGDARCDSPGYSAKYSTYTFQNDATKELVHFELVQVTEATSSVAMETMGFQRGLNQLLECGVDVAVMTTDRSPSIRKLMREEYPQIRHEFDPWHVVKGVKKKLVAASNKKDNKDLLLWVKAITNHLYWSCESSKGDQEVAVRRWVSVLHHISGVHRWEVDGVEYTCCHPPLTDEQQQRKRWIEPGSPAFNALKDIVTDKNLLRDLKQMSLFKHTGSLEVFHSVVLKYAPKRIHFGYDSMRARTQLAIMDHNENVDRPQDTNKKGELRYSFKFSRQSHEWVTQPIYVRTAQTFRRDLMERVLQMRDDPNVLYTVPRKEKRPPHKRLLQNIAPVPRPDRNVLVARPTSRFGRLFRATPY